MLWIIASLGGALVRGESADAARQVIVTCLPMLQETNGSRGAVVLFHDVTQLR